MDKSRASKLSAETVNQILEENEALKAIATDYTELKKFAEDVVEKHNSLVIEYKSKQSEIHELKEKEQELTKQLKKKEDEISALRSINKKMEKGLEDFQNHINNLLDKFEMMNEQNRKQEATIQSLERYIELMDTSSPRIKNERGAGRKKKYTQQQIDFVVEHRLAGEEYESITEEMNARFTDKEWGVKELKYIFSRYKE